MRYIIQAYGDIVCSPDWYVEGVFGYCRLYYAKGGETTYQDCNGSWLLHPGSLYVFPCGVQYQITHNSEKPFDVLWFHVRFTSCHVSETTEIPTEKDTLLYCLLQSLGYGMKTSGALVDHLFGALYEVIAPAIKVDVEVKADILKACDYINTARGRDCSNKHLASLLGYSEKYFIRLFTKAMGFQPHQYAVDVRLSHAVKFLLEGKSVKETASLLGYASAANFSRDFKAQYELNPTQYVADYANKP
jgi:AraC-like DNA-binding protein